MDKKISVDWNSLREIVKNTDKEILKKVIGGCDGHSIFKPKKFTDAGLDSKVVAAFTKKHHSGDDHKSTIYTNAGEVDALEGVYGLELLEFIAATFEVTSWKSGRGFRASQLSEELIKKLGETKETFAVEKENK
jgi:hypothetical protein